MRHAIHNLYKGTAEVFLPVRTSSAFKEKGVLTPEEFVLAGDTLVQTCPTWSWQGGEASKRKSYLPADKQYLVTRNVPCLKRASALESYGETENVLFDGADDEEGWVETEGLAAPETEEDIPSMDGPAPTASNNAADMDMDDDDIPDMDGFEDGGAVMEADPASLDPSYLVAHEPEDNIVHTRTYDLSITYDKYYQTPRVWLYGYDEQRQPLPPQQALEDVSHDHARKTVTVDQHPHSSISAASIHPCQHASVMRKIIEVITVPGTEPRVDQYLFVFLKFIAAIIPTIEYDYTVSVGR
mmetsp:Transcript_23510/g.28437  ORF Transcript_23510/g.28437 Transcript_23510/m.28437 type:complete len:298 (+) Transcript_23510:258-1151(+)|eukprot:CAMPEP_0197852310 /NCGR_PEP_ID=MMETSP1438-20131217/20224_1 /TAXON_ID=1461541 /ORGANISM="Pterosperma sp., Strain CCMP1384" /LENGTH=297 /DNA_ID=CAMNT_0043466293 /DNA_START=251 /DNA_END=1144 /DNA_ORIENTATION=+